MRKSTVLLDKIAYLRLDQLRQNPKNPRKHSRQQIAKIAASIREHGFNVPILIDEKSVILAGHGRLEAAKLLGVGEVPTLSIAHLTDAQKTAFTIADNKLTEMAEWDFELLSANFQELLSLDFNVELTAFSTAEIDLLIDPGVSVRPQKEEDVVLPSPDQIAVSKPGNLWLLGDHRLYCGDSTMAESYFTLLNGEKAQMVFSDPPYNVPIDGHVCGSGKIKHREFVQASGEMRPDEFTAFLRSVFINTKSYSADGSIHYYFMDWRHIAEITAAGQPVFGPLKQLCVWNKDNAGMGSFYRSKHELVFVFKNGDAPHINNFELGQHGRYRTNVWDYAGVNSLGSNRMADLRLHPTVKPVGLVADAIRDCSKRNGIILDPFCGSGSTIIAAEGTGRRAYAIEIDPLYVDTAIRRWQKETGQQARLAANGNSFNDQENLNREMNHDRR
ncbi:MAG: DNA methylase N-4 [Alphaproteobacteria bacterium]|nr:MAG: DNA methylase N-4 [Alphaproteobacteria bacterium]